MPDGLSTPADAMPKRPDGAKGKLFKQVAEKAAKTTDTAGTQPPKPDPHAKGSLLDAYRARQAEAATTEAALTEVRDDLATEIAKTDQTEPVSIPGITIERGPDSQIVPLAYEGYEDRPLAFGYTDTTVNGLWHLSSNPDLQFHNDHPDNPANRYGNGVYLGGGEYASAGTQVEQLLEDPTMLRHDIELTGNILFFPVNGDHDMVELNSLLYERAGEPEDIDPNKIRSISALTSRLNYDAFVLYDPDNGFAQAVVTKNPEGTIHITKSTPLLETRK